MSQAKHSQRLLRDAFLLFTGAKLLRSIGIRPMSFYGGSTIGFFAGNMAGVYGFDARDTLENLQNLQEGKPVTWFKDDEAKSPSPQPTECPALNKDE